MISAYDRWSDPEGQPHRDAADALAALSDRPGVPDVLRVPPALRSSDPDVAAEAWDHYPTDASWQLPLTAPSLQASTGCGHCAPWMTWTSLLGPRYKRRTADAVTRQLPQGV